jgi:hypothetical protein
MHRKSTSTPQRIRAASLTRAHTPSPGEGSRASGTLPFVVGVLIAGWCFAQLTQTGTADDIELAFEGRIDYSKFSVKILERSVNDTVAVVRGLGASPLSRGE